MYRRRATPLHAARAGAATAWLGAIGVAALLQSNPLVLGAMLAATVLTGLRAEVAPQLLRVLLYAGGMAVGICLINALVSRDGLTVIWRFGELPILGQTNVTLEAVVYGAVLGLRAVELVLLGALYSLTVDPDEVLRAMRRLSFGSALSAAVATRMVPVLIRDSRRLADAQRCRAGAGPGRLVLMRATMSGALDRALDVAATLEVRGYSTAVPRRSQPGPSRRAWSRQDLAFSIAAVAVLGVSVAARVEALTPFRAYPTLGPVTGTSVYLVAAALTAAILAPTWATRGAQR